jgi:antitoxin PrlF
MRYKGKISTSGTSEAIRIEKNLFKQHPEFKQKAEVLADVIGPGTMLISLVDNANVKDERDPVVVAFLAFLEKDMMATPGNVSEVSAEQIALAKELTAGVTVSDEELE